MSDEKVTYEPEEYYPVKGKWLLILGGFANTLDKIDTKHLLPSEQRELREWHLWVDRLLNITIPAEMPQGAEDGTTDPVVETATR
jgi:hypothetical protein